MHAWLRPLLDRLMVGLIPIDGDFGRRDAGSNADDFCCEVQPALHPLEREADEAAWIPRAILYGPPL